MKTTVIEIEIVSPDIGEKDIERIINKLKSIFEKDFQSSNIAYEIRKQTPYINYPIPCPQETPVPQFWWTEQPTCNASERGK